MSDTHEIERHPPAAQWIYRGVWRWLVKWMRVPEEPPTLPARAGQLHRSFQPSPGYLAYLKWQFWVALGIAVVLLIGLWIVLMIAAPMWGIALTAPIWGVLLIPSAISYIAMHLRYDTMWYVMTDRSLRIRHGIWSIHEVTITFENVQTVKVTQGPLQRWFGIGDVEVRTAGGGMVAGAQGGAVEGAGHHGVIAGVTHAAEIRDLILRQLRHSKTAGLGDELRPPEPRRAFEAHGVLKPAVGQQHLAVLREIRDALRSGA